MNISVLFVIGLIVIAYLLGSIPTGYLLALALKGIDIRQYGSGSTGATNVLRTVGKGAAIAVLLIDMLKGALAIYLVRFSYAHLDANLLPTNGIDWLIVGCALFALLGHSKSIWLNFSGGKSAAISLGILFTINPWLGLSTLAVFVSVLGISKIVSLSSISAAISVAVSMFFLIPTLPYLLFAVVAAAYVISRHTSNIKRIIEGTEPKIGQTVST